MPGTREEVQFFVYGGGRGAWREAEQESTTEGSVRCEHARRVCLCVCVFVYVLSFTLAMVSKNKVVVSV